MRKVLFLVAVFIGYMSCEELIEVADISNETLVVLAPKNKTVLKSGTIVFTWEGLEEAETYRLQIAIPYFTEAVQILADSTLSGTSFSTTLENNSYEWRIRAENSGYVTDYTIQSFTVEE